MSHRTVRIGTEGVPTYWKFLSGSIVIDDDGTVLALANNTVVAERLAELLDRHGLLDIDDDAGAVA